MRKKTVKNLCDQIFWYIIYTLPIILTICVCIGGFQGNWYDGWLEYDGDLTNYPFYGIFANFLEVLGFSNQLWLVQVLEDVFIVAGLNFNVPVVLQFTAYFITTVILHVFVDFILFIPRLAHKWMNKYSKEE